jgi:hypothetical protein
MTGPPRPDQPRGPAVSLRETLARALADAADTGRPVPCRGRSGDRWVSEHRSDRLWAVEQCRSCAVLLLCRAAADETHEGAYVWGGRDLTPRPGPKKAP